MDKDNTGIVSWVAACFGLVLLLVAGPAGAVPRADGLSDARTAAAIIERVHGCHHTCEWDAEGLHYHGLFCKNGSKRHTCYIQHRPRHPKDEPK